MENCKSKLYESPLTFKNFVESKYNFFMILASSAGTAKPTALSLGWLGGPYVQVNKCNGKLTPAWIQHDRSDFWECYIWATASEVLGGEAAARGSKRRPGWFNLTTSLAALPFGLCTYVLNTVNVDVHSFIRTCT